MSGSGLVDLPSLRITVLGVHLETSRIAVPTPSRPDWTMPGATSYRVDVEATLTSEDDYELWRVLVGRDLGVHLPGGHCLTAECGSCWACRARRALR